MTWTYDSTSRSVSAASGEPSLRVRLTSDTLVGVGEEGNGAGSDD